jgi:type VI secretion system secreted protein Hcp
MGFDAFLKIEGIEGESTDDAHKNWIEVLSFSWGVTQVASAAASTAGSLSSQRANFSDFSIVKALDKGTPKLMVACASGEHLRSVTMEICRAGGDKQKYMEYKMTDVIVTSVRPGGSGHGETLPLEEISFNYGKIELNYIKTKVEGGGAAGNVPGGWDLKANKKV